MVFFLGKNKAFIGISSFCLGFASLGYTFEFDAKVLENFGYENIDLGAFSGGNEEFTHARITDVYMNNMAALNRYNIYTYDDEINGNRVCFTKEFISDLPIKKEAVQKLEKSAAHTTDIGACYVLENIDAAILVDYQREDNRLDISIPQKYLDSVDMSWVPPSKREQGVTGAFVDYGLIGSYNKTRYSDSSSETEFRSTGVVGMNIGAIRFRANYQYNSKNDYGKSFEWSQRYAFMDIGSLNAKVFGGEIYTRSNVFDSVRIKGLSLFTDENMMPTYLRGYAPQITGTATSNSIVTIKQYGSVLREVQVPTGPFVISDLPSYVTGLVDVIIEGASGDIRQYQMDIAQVPFLTRKGAIRYSANLGQLDSFYSRDKVDTSVVSADGSYGLSNDISIFGGVFMTTNQEYKAINAGLGFNMGMLGAISFDVTQSHNDIAEFGKKLTGLSYRFNYAKRFGMSTSLNLVGYRFSSREFTTIHNYMSMKTGRTQEMQLEKNRVTISFSQTIDQLNGAVSIAATRGTYWNQKSIENYDISFNTSVTSGFFEGTSWQLTASRSKNHYGSAENRYGLFVTIPLDQNYNQRLSYNANYDTGGKYLSQQASYYANKFGGGASVSVGASNKRDFSGSIDYTLSGSFDKDMLFGRTRVSVDHMNNSNRVVAGYDGSITITKGGIATHKRVSENASRLIVDVGAPGVTVGNNNDRSNIFGMAGISGIPDYYRLTYKVDNDRLPANVDVPNNVIDIAVNQGAIAYRSLGAISGEKAITVIRLPDGTYPPFGAVVHRENGANTEVAIIADAGITYLSGLNKKAKFVVTWGNGHNCKLEITSLAPKDLEQLTCYME